MILRPYQEAAVRHALEASRSPGRYLFSAPTGSGKGTIQLALLEELASRGFWITTPSLEIVRGFLERLGVDTDCSSGTLAKRGWELGITTPERLVNRVLSSEVSPPAGLLIDESHEFVPSNKNPETLFAVCGEIPYLGFTATPYRATAKSTRELLETWGEPREIITLRECIEGGWISLPRFSIQPLCDDDEIRVGSGDFAPRATSDAYLSRIEELGALVDSFLGPDGLYDTPTIVSVPSVEVAEHLSRVCRFSTPVTQKTSTHARLSAYQECEARVTALIQVSVLTRGADLPFLRRLIDAQPTLSPVRWMQTIGRVMRPGERRAEVLCTNRNLERHGYLLTGFLPRGAVIASQEAFGGGSVRSGMRVLGLEGLPRFKRIPLPLDGGGEASAFNIYSVSEEGIATDYFAIILPGDSEALWASRQRVPKPNAVFPWDYGSWKRCEAPDDLTGYGTQAKRELSSKQRAWWKNAARRYGLRREAYETLSQRQFAVLPVLKDLKLKIG